MKTAPTSKRASVRQHGESVLEVDRRSGVSSQGRSYTATEVKNEFGRILDEALRGETVVITKHDAPKAVLISIDMFNALKQVPQLKLNALSSEFDALLLRMQSEAARIGMEQAFNASPEQLGKAALSAVRKRG